MSSTLKYVSIFTVLLLMLIRTGNADTACHSLGGTCKYTSQGCSGGYFKRGKCDGASNRRCCIPGTGGLTRNCLSCICEVEGCRRLEGQCNWDVDSISCGPYQIKEPYWTDCGRIGSSWRDCTKWSTCSKTCVASYLDYYGTRCTGGRAPTCQDYARIHNGGPQGCRRSSTLKYWAKVQACCNRVGGCG